MKKLLLGFLIFISIAFISMKFGTQAFTYSDENQVADPPIHFKLNPILWLPSYFIFKNDITDFTIIKALAWAIPYWLTLSYLLSLIVLPTKLKGNQKGKKS